jgi:FtsP/CotA-like multicopper oxidase with cupredoxin domain
MKRTLKRILIGLALALALAGAAVAIALRASLLPPALNMSSLPMDHAAMAMPPGAPPGATALETLVDPPSAAPVKAFTLTAQAATIDLGAGRTAAAWTFNGSAPGPELRVRQGDQVVVTLRNADIAAGVTLHWHGVAVPNAMDGVAGVTQDAVLPGQTFTYRFIASEAGTYWYHSHQSSSIQVLRGLYGLLVVEPAAPITRYDRDYTVDLREWGAAAGCFKDCPTVMTINGSVRPAALVARPGELVRLRLVNSGQDQHVPLVLGAQASVVALDGHDLNQPAPLDVTRFPIAPAQRIDLSLRMPASGSVQLIDADPQAPDASRTLALPIGSGAAPAMAYPSDAPLFDFTRYGTPRADAIQADARFDAEYQMVLGNQLGFYDGAITMRFTINGQVNPYVPPIVVEPGQLVRIHIANPTDDLHPMHLHGHSFAVLAKNGQPLSGSPVVLDTIALNPGEDYDIAFRADNPGLWMDHCHILRHAAKGMGIMVVYPNIATPFSVGSASGNRPE